MPEILPFFFSSQARLGDEMRCKVMKNAIAIVNIAKTCIGSE